MHESEGKYVVRMTLSERLQHGLLIVSFVLLVLTGLPLIVYEWKVVQLVFLDKFSFALRGILHRAGAVLLIGLCLWHLLYMVFTRRGRETARELMIRKKDLTDALESLMYNLGFTSWLHRRGILAGFLERRPYWLFREPPRYGRYNFIEKFEYLAVAWGSVVMIATGFFMWKVELAMRVIPRYVFDVLVIIHGYEAVLAFLAILIWHMYNVHFSPAAFPMSKVWLTGKISRKQLMEEHPLEYEQLTKRQEGEEL